MKQNIQVIRTRTRLGHLHSHHIHVMVGYWDHNHPVIDPTARTKDWVRWQLIYTVEGKGLLTWPSGKFSICPETAVLVSSHTEYTFTTDPELQRWRQYSAVFLPRSHWYGWLNWPKISPGIMSLDISKSSANKAIRQAFNKTITIAETPRPLWEDFTLAALEKVLLLLHTQNMEGSLEQRPANPHLQTAIDYIEKNQDKPFELPRIAKTTGVSPSYLQRLFQKHLHATPHQYVDMLRINKAQRLLRETDKQVSQIGYMVGFDRPAHFCYRFRKLTGQTPGEYRKALK